MVEVCSFVFWEIWLFHLTVVITRLFREICLNFYFGLQAPMVEVMGMECIHPAMVVITCLVAVMYASTLLNSVGSFSVYPMITVVPVLL